MNENANDQGSVTGKAVGTAMGLGASVALTGIGLLAGKHAFKGLGKGIKGIADDVAKYSRSAIKNGADGSFAGSIKNFGKKSNGGILDVMPNQNIKSSSFGEPSPILKSSPAMDNMINSMM